MKKIICLLACLILAWIPSSFAQNPQVEDELILKARQFLAALEKKDFQAATGDFDETMAKVFGPEKMAEFWKQVPNQLSPFKRQTAARREVLGPYDVVLVTCAFEKTTLDARIVFNFSSRGRGFRLPTNTPRNTVRSRKMSSPISRLS